MVFSISIGAGALGGAPAVDHISAAAPLLLGVAATVTVATIRTRPQMRSR